MTKEIRAEINEIKKKFKDTKETTLTSNELLLLIEECKWTYCFIPCLNVFTLVSKDEVKSGIKATYINEYKVKLGEERSSLKSIFIG